MRNSDCSRREFVRNAAVGAASFAVPTLIPGTAFGANDRISIGLIGCGGRGNALMQAVLGLKKEHDLEIRVLCDVWKVDLRRTLAELAKRQTSVPDTCSRHGDVVSRSDIDAVIIATADFAHAPILVDALKAKKDVYVEKPMATQLAYAREAVRLARENKAVVQVGTQFRSDLRHKKAAELVQSGVLGKISEVEASYHDAGPRWARSHSDVRREDVDWEGFLMHLSPQPFSAERFRRWHLYKDFTLGTPALLGVHRMDVATWFMDDPLPLSAVALGGVYVWKDGREHADTVDCILTYPKEFMLNYSTRLGNSRTFGEVIFYGTRGTFDIKTWTARGDGGGADALKEPVTVAPISQGDLTEDHMRNWLDCIKSRTQTNAPIEAGYAHSVASILCFQALETGRRQTYDRVAMTIREG
ncbi:MAG: Gfo/Idh/MocA family oxidoreductase [Sedimentisphaerales bacterium]|nr:Gfo/Idh/MocA family oxidoreductase [Sedimentisphaerales bacterium]